MLLTGAALGDRFGRRRMLTHRHRPCSPPPPRPPRSSPSVGALITARVFQGVGAASRSADAHVDQRGFPVEKRGAAIGMWGAIAGIAVAIGPVVGGAIIKRHRLALDLLAERADRCHARRSGAAVASARASVRARRSTCRGRPRRRRSIRASRGRSCAPTPSAGAVPRC